MKQLRKIIFWCHLATGTLAGIIIFAMSLTGVLLTYEKQIEWWADTRVYHVAQPLPDGKRLSVEELLGKIRATQSSAPTNVTFYSDHNSPGVVSFPGGKRLYVDPYTGDVFGEGSPGVHNFFSVVTNWHRWLGTSGENREVGRAITGASNLLFLFIVISGFYLWWPRKWTRKSLRAVTWLKTGQKGRARDFNWHNVFGFWSALPLFIVVLSGVVMSYTWASNMIYKVVGEEPPAQQQRGGPSGSGMTQQEASTVPLDGLESLLVRAQQQVESWRSITLQIPQKPDAPVTFAIDRGNGGQPQLRSQLTLDRVTGEVIRWEPYTSYTTGRRLRTWFRFAHTGEFYGFIGQTIAGLASLGALFLVFTGLMLAWRRFYSWRVRRSEDSNQESEST
jgi:uncharacterized iron-regulated membrane protein